MKIKYIDGYRFHQAFIAGSTAVIKNEDYLNKINVFPVSDADTGTNMASTMNSILESSKAYRSLQKTIQSIADSALTGARGNSGIIFAQFIYGLCEELRSYHKISTDIFAQSLSNSMKYVYKSMLNPVEGTIITVMKDWSQAIYANSSRTKDFYHLFTNSLQVAKESLKNTPNQLPVLSKAGVVDAGANGFVNFLDGIYQFIHKGKIIRFDRDFDSVDHSTKNVIHNFKDISYRYCTEAMIRKLKLDLSSFQKEFGQYGDSLIVAGSHDKIHLHIHTDEPNRLFKELHKIGNVSNIKVDDMKLQHELVHNRKFPIALVTDSACDLPEEYFEKYQISQIPFNINFGKEQYLDKVTITANEFYKKLQTDEHHPKSSQPSMKTVRNLYSFLSGAYDKIISIHISDKLTGMYNMSKQFQTSFPESNIAVFNSKQLTVSQGLIVLRTAQAIEQGIAFAELKKKIQNWIEKTDIYVDVNTLKYMVRGGRVSPLKGLLATALNIKPIVTLDNEGKAAAAGKSFSRRGNLQKIVSLIKKKSQQKKIWNYAIVHADAPSRAQIYAEKLTDVIGKKPAYIMELSPVVGVHNGIGALGIGIMEE